MSTAVEPSPHIHGVFTVRLQKFGDGRGYFYETYRRSWQVPGMREMVQSNCSFSRAGVLRGLHYHFKQADLWSVPQGRVRAGLFDYRTSSPTFRRTSVFEMSHDQPTAVYIPKGVAHGFFAIEDSFMTYLVDECYDGKDELGIRWNDPALGLDWKLGTSAPLVSERDARNLPLSEIPAELQPR